MVQHYAMGPKVSSHCRILSTSQHELKIHGGNREVRLRGESRRERSFRSLDLAVVRARRSSTTWAMPAARTPHTYLDGTVPFTSVCCGPRGPPIARRPCPQGEPAVCMGFGSCTVPIFSCPAPALGLGGLFCVRRIALTLTLDVIITN